MTRIDGRWLVNLNTCAGIVLALGLAAAGYVMLGGGWSALAHPAAATIVVAGAIAGLLACCRAEDVAAAWRAIGPAFSSQPSAEDVIEPLVRAARMARRQGLVSVEQSPSPDAPAFLKDALALAADGVAPETMRQVLDVQQRALRRRDEAPAAVIDAAARCALWAGVLGAALIALAAVQSTATLAPGALTAPPLAALLYGLCLSSLMRPIAARMRRHAGEAAAARELIADGVLGIRDGMTPRLVDQALRGRAGLALGELLAEAPRRVA